MKFINKKNFLKTLPITKYEESIIFNKGQSSDDNSHFIQKLFSLKDNYWIACDCTEDAFLIICSLNSNLYIRCKTLDTHNKNCFFRYNKNVCLNKKTKSISK